MSRAAQQRSAMRKICDSLAVHTPIDEIYRIVATEVRRLTGATTAAICLLTQNRDMLDYVAASGGNADDITGLRIRVCDSLSQEVVSTGQLMRIDSPSAASTGSLFSDLPEFRFTATNNSQTDQPDSSASHSAIVAPIWQDGSVIGTISAMNKVAGGRESAAMPFDPEDVDTLELFAETVSLARNVNLTASIAREQAREMAAMYDSARHVAASLNIQEVLESVLNAICAHLEHHSVVLFLLNDERTHLFIAAERGLTEPEREIQLAVDSGAYASVLDNGVPILLDDPDDDQPFDCPNGTVRSRSIMIAPMRSRNETHGLVVVNSLQRRAYRPEDLKLLAAISMQAGVAIDNAFLFEQAQRQAQEIAALYDLSQHVNSTLHLDRALNFVADSVIQLLQADRFALLLYQPAEERLVPRIVRNLDAAAFEAVRPRTGEGIAGWVFEWQTPQAVADVAADSRNLSAPIDGFVVASTLCVPLQVGDEVIGVMLAMSARRRLFTVAEMELLYTIANQAASAVSNATMYQEARSRSREMRRYFSRVAQAIGSTLDSQDLPRLLADLSVEIMRADRCAVYRIEGDLLNLAASSGFRASAGADLQVPIGCGLSGWVARKRSSLSIANLEGDPRSDWHSWLARDPMASYVAVPIRSERRVVGVVELYTQAQRTFTREEVQLFTTFVRRARVAEKLAIDRPHPLET